MRLDVVTENPIEAVARTLGLLPTGSVKVVWGFAMARTLTAAVELGIFAALKEGPLSSTALAEKLSCDAEGMRTLCSALNAFGLLTRRDDVFTLTKESHRYLTDAHGSDLSETIRFGAVLDEKLRRLAQTVKTGKKDLFHENLREDEWSAYLGGLGSMATVIASEVVRKLKLASPTRLLDVAGGHGGFSKTMCAKYPALHATVLDLPQGVAVGERLLAQDAARARITFTAGDLRTTPWGEGYDVVFLFNILHNLLEADAKRAVVQAHAALAPRGMLVILEGQHAGGRGNLSYQEGFSELLFHVLSASNTWPEPVLREWLREAGFTKVKKQGLFTLPGGVLLSSKKSG
jgi:ubiquinone/menaquinone biosynthesis C-methylase UbiE